MRLSKGRAWTTRISASLALLGLLSIAGASPVLAGAWTLEKGKGLAIVTGFASRADKGFAAERKTRAIAGFRKVEIQGLAEYGISDRFTARVRTEVQDVRQEGGDPERRTGLGFSEIGGRYRFFGRGGFVASAEANLRLAEVQEIVDPAQAGLLEAEYEARLLGGYGFTLRERPSFANVELAYRARAGDRPDEIRVDTTLGIRPTPRLLALAQVFSVVSAGSAESLASYDYHKVQLSGVYDVTPRISAQLGGFTTVAGRNALREDGLLSALWFKF